MSLTSLSFLGVYFPLLLIAYYNPIIKGNTFRKIILICASLGLYAFCEPIYILLLMEMIFLNYYLVKLADKTNRNIFRGIAIAIDALILLGFKYINVFLSWGTVDNSLSSIVFPIGLSYFMFKAISYVVDSRDEKQGNLLDAAIYISNFLTIVSGPLSTYKDELPCIRSRVPVAERSNLYRGLVRIVVGLGKKVIIADSLGVLVAQCFSSTELSAVMAWTGAIAYTLQLYFDFSGYTDVAIGVGYLFGFHLPENFNYPYMACSISDFWKRWHMSLTKWFTKYIYFPLGGSRVKTVSRHIFNLFVVWFVTGMWHGSAFTFIIWAMIYFALQLIEKYTSWSDILQKIHLAHFYTLFVIVVEWAIFRSASLSEAAFYLKSMFLLMGNPLISELDVSTISKYAIPLTLGVIFSTNIGEKIKNIAAGNVKMNALYNLALLAMFLVCVVILLSQGYSAPLYAGF